MTSASFHLVFQIDSWALIDARRLVALPRDQCVLPPRLNDRREPSGGRWVPPACAGADGHLSERALVRVPRRAQPVVVQERERRWGMMRGGGDGASGRIANGASGRIADGRLTPLQWGVDLRV